MSSISGTKGYINIHSIIFIFCTTVKVTTDPTQPDKAFLRSEYPPVNTFMADGLGLTEEGFEAGEILPLTKKHTELVHLLFKNLHVRPQYDLLPILPIDEVLAYYYDPDPTIQAGVEAFNHLLYHHQNPATNSGLWRNLITINENENHPSFQRLDKLHPFRLVTLRYMYPPIANLNT
jgi:hypothetical protein